MKSKRKSGYSTILVFTILMALGALFTLAPYPGAYRVSLLGYKSTCTIAPISTLACLGLAWMGYKNMRRFFVEA